MQRIEKENYYLDIAETVLERSTCLRRQYGAIIVRNDRLQRRAQRQKKLLRPRQVRARAAAGAARRAL